MNDAPQYTRSRERRVQYCVVVAAIVFGVGYLVAPAVQDHIYRRRIKAMIVESDFASVPRGGRVFNWMTAHGESIVPDLVVLLDDQEDWEVSANASIVLAELSSNARAATSALLSHVHDPRHPALRIRVIEALGQIAPGTVYEESVVMQLRVALADEHVQVRSTAASTLRLFGAAAKPATEELMKAACSDDSDFVRQMAVYALGGIKADRGDVLPQLYELRDSTSGEMLHHVESTIAELETGITSTRTQWYQTRIPLW